MRLDDWLRFTRTPRCHFAEQIGVRPSMVTNYCSDTTWPSRTVAEAIVEQTNGLVTANDMLSSSIQTLITRRRPAERTARKQWSSSKRFRSLKKRKQRA